MANKKLYLITKQKVANAQRKLAFFSKQPKGLYFEVGGFFIGSHTSYHCDGNIFMTSPATNNKPRFQGRYLAFDKFEGCYQLGTSMITKESIGGKPVVRDRDFRRGTVIYEVNLDLFPSITVNLVVEFIEPNKENLLQLPNIAPPLNAKVYLIKEIEPWIVLTILGHDENLLIKPNADGFFVRHINTRYSTNQSGVNYTYEAYG